VLALVLAAAGILALVLALVRWGAERRRSAGEIEGDAALSGSPTRAYTLYFVEQGQLVGERREVVAKPSQAAQLSAVVTEMLAGSLAGHDPAVPEGTVLRHLFMGDNGLITLDLSREVQRRQAGSLEAEYVTLAALVRSVKDNFPEVHSVQILIDGKPEPTLAGHFSIADPLLCADWLPAAQKASKSKEP
jgi:spore germination protein GerM